MLHLNQSERFHSVAPTESSSWTEAYNTASSDTPRSDLSTPPPSTYCRRKFTNHQYEEMTVIKEEDYEDIGDLGLFGVR